LERLTEILAPISHKILVSIPGNHENRTERKTGIDVAQVLAERLEIPYFNGPVNMTVLANGFKWAFYIFHGYGNSQTKGGKLTMAGKAKSWTGHVNFFVSGHVHDPTAESETAIIEDPLNCRLLYVKQWVVISQAFLGWYGSYAYKAGMKPPSQGSVTMELDDDGNYRACLRD